MIMAQWSRDKDEARLRELRTMHPYDRKVMAAMNLFVPPPREVKAVRPLVRRKARS